MEAIKKEDLVKLNATFFSYGIDPESLAVIKKGNLLSTFLRHNDGMYYSL